jgi:hypothetical protein
MSAVDQYRSGMCSPTGCNAMSICGCSIIEELCEEVDALRQVISELGYCTPTASLEFMQLVPSEVKAALAKARGQ